MQTRDLSSLSEGDAREFVAILVRYQPYQERFVADWERLGPHNEASEFWEKELHSVRLRIRAIDRMDLGSNQNNDQLFGEGLDLFLTSQQIGHEAESAMLEVRSRCID